MKIKTKIRLSALSWFIGGLFLMFLSLYLTRWFIVFLIGLFLFNAFFVMSLKCPNCQKPVLNNPIRIFGLEMWLTTPWMPKKCSKCGHDLNEV